jgi:hypothetical protein
MHESFRRTAGLTFYAIAVALLIVLALELFLSVRQESQVFDEAAHLYAGFEYWKHGDFGRNPEHPPLAKLVAAIPLLHDGSKEPGDLPIPYFKAQDFIGGAEFLYTGDADSALLKGRIAIAIFTLGLAVLVLAAGREMFGAHTALLALGLFVFEPVVLANGALVTTDMALACLFFASVYAFYRYVKEPSWIRLAVCAAATTGALASKHSGGLILLTLGLLAGIELLVPDRVWSTAREIPSPAGESARLRDDAILEKNKVDGKVSIGRRALIIAGALLLIAVAGYVGLWAFYGFRYAARPDGLQMFPPLTDYLAELTSPVERGLIGFLARHHLLPEAYLYGWADVLRIPATRPMFLLGKIYSTGKWFFFPAVFVIKSTLTLLVLLGLTCLAGLEKQRRESLFLVVPSGIFFAAAMVSGLNLGVRHILPIYPFCIVLAAATGWRFAARSRLATVGVVALLLLIVASSLHAFPDYLAYSNEAFGGPSNTYRAVTDANADWGQGLKWVKSYIDKHGVTDCWFDYSNPFVNPAYYGIQCRPLLSSIGFQSAGAIPPTISGTVFISATEAEGLFWGPGTLNPYEPFKHRQPDEVIGNVVLAYSGTFDVPLLAAHSHAGLASGLLGQGRVQEAMAEVQLAARLAPDSAQITATLGQVLMAAGRKTEAQDAFSKALQLARANYPEHQAALIRGLEGAMRK